MCGRFTLRTPGRDIVAAFDLPETPDLTPHYNIAPSQEVAVVRKASDDGRRQLVWLRWGLIPPWADDPAIGNRLINARSETVASRRAFRHAFEKRRCLVVADGFFEWKREGRQKQPYYITLADQRPLAFAGLWERWQRDSCTIESCTILTTGANDLLRPLHDRMPVILPPGTFDAWLDADVQDPQALEGLMQPFPAEQMQAHPVSPLVNKTENDRPECIEVMDAGQARPPRNLRLFD
jgi:putative SOS response-associated peptidase YedK